MFTPISRISVFVLLFVFGEFPVAAQVPSGLVRKARPSFRAVKLLASRVNFAGLTDPKLTLSDALSSVQKLTDLDIVETRKEQEKSAMRF